MESITAPGRLRPRAARRFQERVRAHDVGAQKALGILDGSIHVRLGRKVHDGVEALLPDESSDLVTIADVTVHEAHALRLDQPCDARAGS